MALRDPASQRAPSALLDPSRLAVVLGIALLWGLLLGTGWKPNPLSAVVRTVAIGLVALLAFGVLERWPRTPPRWLARWVLQVLGVAISVPVTTFVIYVASTAAGAPPFWQDKERLGGFLLLTVSGLLFTPWVALGALVRQKDALARHQALKFELERSELQRQALDARLRLLQAQVAPHFLFNTLANVQALVEAGSPKAPDVLRSLVAYLRAAIPRLDESATTVGRELELAQAYLEVMQTRMPDRLQFEIVAESAVSDCACPPLSVLTLVENAVRHGIDPCEDGGVIAITARRLEDRCRIVVTDTGAGLAPANSGLGTGLRNLRERLQQFYEDAARMSVEDHEPHGVQATIEFPALEAPESR